MLNGALRLMPAAEESLLLTAETFGEVCSGIGTSALAAEILAENVYAVLGQRMELTPMYAMELALAARLKRTQAQAPLRCLCFSLLV